MTHALRAVFFLAGILALSPHCAAQSAAEKRASKDKKPAPAQIFIEDKGRLRLLVEGQQVGMEEFQIAPDGSSWTARAKVELKSGSATVQVTSLLRLASDGAPLLYECATQAARKDSVAVAFNGAVARMDMRTDGSQPFSQEITYETPRVIILDNNLYHHYAILARLYDWQAKGAQSFPVLIPQDQVPGRVTAEAAGPQEVEGVRYDVLRVRSDDLVIDLFLDPARRLMRLSVADSKAEVIREK